MKNSIERNWKKRKQLWIRETKRSGWQKSDITIAVNWMTVRRVSSFVTRVLNGLRLSKNNTKRHYFVLVHQNEKPKRHVNANLWGEGARGWISA